MNFVEVTEYFDLLGYSKQPISKFAVTDICKIDPLLFEILCFDEHVNMSKCLS